MKNTKRETEEYLTYQVYPEINFVNELEGEELLCLGMVYNYTGKNTTTFLIGKNVNGVTKAFNMNGNSFGVKKLTRNDVRGLLDRLTDKGWFVKGTPYSERAEYNGKVTTKELTPLTISEMGMMKIKEGVSKMVSPEVSSSLF